ncbi:MAG: 16S rRNA processing protein RimM [Clostridia bacterium]|nr:16S rRNA processing protein RimM [Clostridia bacterium]
MNLLEIGKIVRPHGVKGAVKVLSYVDEDFSIFKHIYISHKKVNANIKKVLPLNNDAYSVTIDVIPDIDTAEKFRNMSIYIDREEYSEFQVKIYMSDLLNKPVINEKGEQLGDMVDFDDYGATIILTIRCGSVSYTIPYVDDIIVYDEEKDAFVIEEQKFKDLRV